MTAQAYERRFRGEDLDPFASRVYTGGDGSPVGIVLVARRGWTSRIAAMALAPEARGQGLGRRLLGEAVEEARTRGDRAVLLEVIEQNTPAVRRALEAAFPGRAWSVSAIVPEDLAPDFFPKLGWERTKLTQARDVFDLGS